MILETTICNTFGLSSLQQVNNLLTFPVKRVTVSYEGQDCGSVFGYSDKENDNQLLFQSRTLLQEDINPLKKMYIVDYNLVATHIWTIYSYCHAATNCSVSELKFSVTSAIFQPRSEEKSFT